MAQHLGMNWRQGHRKLSRWRNKIITFSVNICIYRNIKCRIIPIVYKHYIIMRILDEEV